MLGLKLALASWGSFPIRLEGTGSGAPPSPCEKLEAAGAADSLPAGDQLLINSVQVRLWINGFS